MFSLRILIFPFIVTCLGKYIAIIIPYSRKIVNDSDDSFHTGSDMDENPFTVDTETFENEQAGLVPAQVFLLRRFSEARGLPACRHHLQSNA